MAQIVPAILEKTRLDFEDKMSKILKLPGVERIQVDFGDGIFVPNSILPVTEIEPLNPAFHWEAHLMVKEPQDFLDYQINGFNTIIVHYEAYPSVQELHRAVAGIKALGLLPGICLNHDTPVSVLKEFEEEVRHYQIMGIKAGFQGTPFFEDTYDRIRELRGLIRLALIEMDGGAKLENVKQLAQAGADLIIAGSALVKAPNMLEAYDKLQAELL